MVTIRFPSNVKTGGSNTRLNSQPQLLRLKSGEVKMFASAATMGKSCDLKSKGKLEAHPDWFQAVGEMAAGELYPLIAKLECFTDESIDLRPGKPTMIGSEYQNSGRSLKSVRIAWDNQDANGKCRVLISVPGQVISAMPMLWVRGMAMQIVLAGLKCTRFDATIDDYGKRLNFSTLAESLLDGNYSKFRTWNFQYSSKGGISFKLGSRESPRSTTMYDKAIESEGKINAYRIETKFGGKVAHDVLLGWLMIDPDELGASWEDESAKYLAQSVVGSIDFRDRQLKPDEKNLKRIPRLGWWQEFVTLIEGELYHTAPVATPTLQKKSNWHINQAFRSLICAMKGFGDRGQEWLEYRLKMAEITLKPVHLHQIEQFKTEYELYVDKTDFGLPKAA